MNNLISRAILFATERHIHQKRKGTDLPYIVHPLEVMNILIRMNAEEELVAAGILHDTLEDTATTYKELAEHFGTAVAELVAAHTHPKKNDWWETRQHALEILKDAPRPVQMLVLADKLSNLRSMAADYKLVGEQLWERFNAPKHMQSRYYSASLDALVRRSHDPATAWAYQELEALCAQVFE